MDAKILPLYGKYYGTKIKIESGPASGSFIGVWVPTGEPSDREIESWGFTRSDWVNNVMVDDGWGGKAPIQSLDYVCDSHYESDISLRIASAIVEALKHVD